MPTREEQFYEVAAREVAENQPSQGVWGKAFILSVGDEQKAKALYIKLRVDQLEREYQQSIADLIRDSRDEITGGKPFLCPYCERRTTAKSQNVDFFAQLFTGALPYRYYCGSCGFEMRVSGTPVKAKSAEAPAADRSNNVAAVTGFVLGLASVVLYFVGIIPILAVVFSGVGLATFKPEAQKNKWMAGVGLALGGVYTIMMLSHYGHLK